MNATTLSAETLESRIRTILALDPSRGAIEHGGTWSSWGTIASLMAATSAALEGQGAGAPIGMILRNRPAHVAALLEVLLSGRCLVPINPFQSAEKLDADLVTLRCPVVIADAEDWPVIGAAVRSTGARGFRLVGTGDGLAIEAVTGLENPRPGPFRDPMPGIGIEMLTSGTTGPAKRIRLPYANFERSLLDALFYEAGGREVRLKNAVVFAAAPLVHIGGLWAVIPAFLSGRSICLFEKFNVAEWHSAVVRHRPKLVPLVPTALRMVYDANLPKGDLASLIAIRTGTAPLDPELQASFEDRYGVPLLDSYGATEFAGGVAGWTLDDHRQFARVKRGSVGRAQPLCQLRVIDRESGAALAPGQVGLLEVRAAHINDVEWVRTTDLAEIDADGFLFIRGRADDAIIRGGFKILPGDVAKAISHHPSVKEAAVVGLKDERLGAVPVAAVELHEGAPVPTEEELLATARKHLVAYMVPVRVRVVDALPRTPSMKVSRPEVRALFETGKPS